MSVSAFVFHAFSRYLDKRGIDLSGYAWRLGNSGRTARECEDALADYVERLAIGFQNDVAGYADSDVTTQLVEDCNFYDIVDTDMLFYADGYPRDRFGPRVTRSASRASKPKSKAPAGKATKPKSKGGRR